MDAEETSGAIINKTEIYDSRDVLSLFVTIHLL